MADDSHIARRELPIVRWLLLMWLGMMVISFYALSSPEALAAQNKLSLNRAIFTAVNAGTMTGFSQQFAKPGDFGFLQRLILLFQLFSGTMLSLIGGGILINRLLGHPFSNRRIAGLGLALITFASLAGWMIAHGDVDWITGVSRGLSALACAGLPPGGVPAATDRVLLLLLFPISMIGSLGLIALLGLITRRRDVSDDGHFHARRVIAVRLAAYLVCTLSVVWLIENVSGANLLDLPRASALALSSLGYGLPVERMANFPRGVDAIVLIFMLLSAGTLSATGGMGIAWLITLPSRWTNWVLIGIGVQIALIVTAYLMLSQTEPQLPADRLAILAVSGGMNVGISHEPVSITGPGLLTLSGLMLAGRLLPLLWVAALIRRKA